MGRPTNALIVDDEVHVRVFLRVLLKELGITEVWEAADGAEGLAMAGKFRPRLVLLDVNLPMMNGLDVLRHLIVELPHVPVVMVTSQSAMKTVMEAAKLGAAGYLLKHSARAEVLKLLREIVDRADQNEDEDGDPAASESG
ncbi:MAG: response regulator [Verrucomicrobia bacterium]|nr:response regulator [Verrucomicrobiota bacterium]